MKTSLGPQTLLEPTPVLLVGTYDAGGKPNAMVAAWGGICCSAPPCVAVSLRPATHSHRGILERRAFTVSLPGAAQIAKADYFGIVSGRDTDKFAATGWTPVHSEAVDAPYIGECPLVLECRLRQTHEIGGHTQFIGEIVDIKADAEILTPEGKVDLQKLAPVIFSTTTRSYYGFGEKLAAAFEAGKNAGK